MSETRAAPWHLTASEMDAEWDRLHAKIADLRYQLAERDAKINEIKGYLEEIIRIAMHGTPAELQCALFKFYRAAYPKE